MKKSTFAIMLLASGAMLAACTQEKLSDEIPAGQVPLQVSSDILTRAYDNVWEAGDAIGITGTSGSKTYTNVSYTTTGDGHFSITNSGEEIYFQNDDEVTFTAYYPWNDDTEFENVDTWYQAEQKTFDFLWAQATGSKASPNVAFSFNHVMSKLVITVKAGDDVTLSEIQNAKLSLSGFNHLGTFDVTDGSTSTVNNAAEYTFAGNTEARYNAPYTENSAESSRTFTLILFPQFFGSNPTFKAEFTAAPDTQEFTAKLDFTSANATRSDNPARNEWVAGRQYNLIVTLHKTPSNNSGTIGNWVDTGNITADAR